MLLQFVMKKAISFNSYYEYNTPANVDYINHNSNILFIKYSSSARIELRFFMQPLDPKQMLLEIDFGLHLLNWMWQQTVNGVVFTRKNITKDDIRRYSTDESKTLKEIKTACEEMDFPYHRLVDCWRIDNLKTKFLYQEKYFV